MAKKIRSVLFVPGSRPERIAKAAASAADVVIIDLEDAVPADKKSAARQDVRQALQQNQDRTIWVRINGPDTDWIRDDVDAVLTAGLDGVMVPKLETPQQALDIYDMIRHSGRISPQKLEQIAFVPLIETALSVQNAYDLAALRVDDRKICLTLAFGAADFTLDMGVNMTPGGQELHYPRARIAVACRAAGIEPPLDTPYMIDIKDAAGLQTDAQRARELGFQGKLCVHPARLEVVNAVFSPTAAEIEFAQRVLAAFETAKAKGEAAVQVDGKFVDPPIVGRAQQIVDCHQRLGAQAKD